MNLEILQKYGVNIDFIAIKDGVELPDIADIFEEQTCHAVLAYFTGFIEGEVWASEEALSHDEVWNQLDIPDDADEITHWESETTKYKRYVDEDGNVIGNEDQAIRHHLVNKFGTKILNLKGWQAAILSPSQSTLNDFHLIS